MRSLISLVLASAALLGCAAPQFQEAKTLAQVERDRLTASLKEADTRSSSCLQDVRGLEQYVRFHREILFENDESANKFQLLALKEKYSSEQISFIATSIPIITKCRKHVVESHQGTPFLPVTINYYNSLDILYVRMIRGDLSISEANHEKIKIQNEWRIQWANLMTETNAQIRRMHESELAGRRQAAAEIWSGLMQQQYSQQLNQQRSFQQQLQSLNNTKPLLTSPTITTCQSVFNQLVCTTK